MKILQMLQNRNRVDLGQKILKTTWGFQHPGMVNNLVGLIFLEVTIIKYKQMKKLHETKTL